MLATRSKATRETLVCRWQASWPGYQIQRAFHGARGVSGCAAAWSVAGTATAIAGETMAAVAAVPSFSNSRRSRFDMDTTFSLVIGLLPYCHSIPDTSRLHQAVGCRAGITHPLRDLLGLGRVLQFDTHGALEACVLQSLEIQRKIDHATARREVVLHGVAIGEVHVSDPPSEFCGRRGHPFEFEIVALSE